MVFGLDSYRDISDKPRYKGMVATTVSRNIRQQYYSNSPLPIGRAVVWDEPGVSVKLPDAAGQKILGFTTHCHLYEFNEVDGYLAYPAKVAVEILDEGEIGLDSEVPIDIGINDKVFQRHTANGANDALGSLRNDDDGGNAEQIPNTRWIRSGNAGDVLAVQTDKPALGY